MNVTGKYLKVWEVEARERVTLVNLGDSRKNKDGGYDSWTWYKTAFVGQAKGPAAQLNKGDVIEIKSGQISQNKADNGKWYTNVVVFEFDVTKHAEEKQESAEEINDGPLPF